jgi:LPXTG-site transpeptidase (sortase) family protein
MLRRVAIGVGAMFIAVSSAALIYQAVTPAPILGHADPHGDGILGQLPGLPAIAGLGSSAPKGTSSSHMPTPVPVVVAPRTGVWIEMPVLDIALPVSKGDGSVSNVPLWKALVYPGTSWPGKPGNSYIYAHAQWGMFANLLYARVGDTAYIHDYGTGRIQTFHVSRVIGQIPYDDGTWLHYQASRPTLTLQTCMDWNSKGNRFVVQLT